MIWLYFRGIEKAERRGVQAMIMLDIFLVILNSLVFEVLKYRIKDNIVLYLCIEYTKKNPINNVLYTHTQYINSLFKQKMSPIHNLALRHK